MGDSTQWWDYVQRHMDKRGWNTMDFERHSGINRTRLVAWRDGGAVSIDNARAIAAAFGDHILTVLVAAGILTPQEAKQPAVPPIDPATLSAKELAAEVTRRLVGAAPTAEDIEANPSRYTVLGKGQTTPKRRKNSS